MDEPKEEVKERSRKRRPVSGDVIVASVGGLLAICASAFFSYLGAQKGVVSAAAPQVRIQDASWIGEGHEINVSGEVLSLTTGLRVWLFSSRLDGVGGVYPAPEECHVDAGAGLFSCSTWAGSEEETGLTYELSVAVVTSDQATQISQLVKAGGSYSDPIQMPKVDGGWSTDVTRMTR